MSVGRLGRLEFQWRPRRRGQIDRPGGEGVEVLLVAEVVVVHQVRVMGMRKIGVEVEVEVVVLEDVGAQGEVGVVLLDQSNKKKSPCDDDDLGRLVGCWLHFLPSLSVRPSNHFLHIQLSPPFSSFRLFLSQCCFFSSVVVGFFIRSPCIFFPHPTFFF